MAVELVMPRLGWTMEEGVFVEWLKQDGDLVAAGDVLFSVDSDKATSEVESFENGVLRIPPQGPAPGATIPVGAVLGYIVQPGEAAPFELEARSSTPATAAHPDLAFSAVEVQQPKGPPISPRARRVAGELGLDWQGLDGSGRTGRIVERDVRAAHVARQVTVPRATPLARRVARELGVDLAQLPDTLPQGRIMRADVERVVAAANAAAPAAHSTATAAVAPVEARRGDLPFTGIRRITATRMAESAHTTAPVTLTTDADATELTRLRKQIAGDLQDSQLPPPSYTDLLAKLVAVALGEHPALNASLTERGIEQHPFVHIGIAADTARGLLVPVIQDVQRKSIQQIASDSGRLLAQARDGTIAVDDLCGSTFTITNLGMYGIDAFTPIINLPECAILGLGRIAARPVVVDEDAETIAVRKMMALSLTFDHRVVDGAPAARFLQRVRYFVEHPYSWLTR